MRTMFGLISFIHAEHHHEILSRSRGGNFSSGSRMFPNTAEECLLALEARYKGFFYAGS
jgi:hypothetical protein